MNEYHVPVMVKEVVEGLAVGPGKVFVDATVGGGGHAEAIIRAGGSVVGIDQDEEALEAAGVRLSVLDKGTFLHKASKFSLVKGNFRDLAQLVRSVGMDRVDGVLFDLGVSSHQLDDPRRGFQFEAEALDMRMDQAGGSLTAAEFLAQLEEADLARLLWELGEERYAKRFARAIVNHRGERPITSATQLRQIIWQASPFAYRRGKIHPATRTFQALRLAVNNELGSLVEALPQAVDLMRPGARLAVISFHSLEDRIAKQFMQTESLVRLTRKPLTASGEEVQNNPRARSAKLRLAEKASQEQSA